MTIISLNNLSAIFFKHIFKVELILTITSNPHLVNAHEGYVCLIRKQHKQPIFQDKYFLPTAREGNVFRSVCLFTGRECMMSLPVWSHVLSGGVVLRGCGP